MSTGTPNDSDSIGQQKLPDYQHTITSNIMDNDTVGPSASSPVLLRSSKNNNSTQQNAEINSNNTYMGASGADTSNNTNSYINISPKKAEVPLEAMLNDPEGFYAPRKSSDSKPKPLNMRAGSGHNKSRSMDITAWAKILKGEKNEAEEEKKRASIDSREPPPSRSSTRQLNRRDSVIVTFFSKYPFNFP